MMAGGNRAHARVQMNLSGFLREALGGSGCRPFESDMGGRTKELALRYPDVTVDCGAPSDGPLDQVLGNPIVIVEVLSPTTRDYDLRTKKAEYREIGSVRTIAFIDPEAETLSVSQRIEGGWTDTLFAVADLSLPDLSIVIPHGEIFDTD